MMSISDVGVECNQLFDFEVDLTSLGWFPSRFRQGKFDTLYCDLPLRWGVEARETSSWECGPR